MTGPRGHREGELDPQAAAALRAFRAADDMPAAAQERVWARLSAVAEAPETGSKGNVSRGMSEWAWAGVIVAAAAALLLASRAGVLGPLVGTRGGEAAAYAEKARTPVSATGRADAPASGVRRDVPGNMTQETGDSAEAPAPAQTVEREEVETGSAPGRVRSESRGETARTRPRGESAGGESGAPERATPGGTSGAPGGGASALALEAEALARAQAAIQAGRAEEALAALADYTRRFPRGTLREEHDALRALALCAAGRRVEGRGEAKAFLGAHGGSALAERVRRGCLDE